MLGPPNAVCGLLHYTHRYTSKNFFTMKHILIPTDFSIKSLKLVHAAASRAGGQKLNIYLVHALEPDHSISGLLMTGKRQRAQQLCTEEFNEACAILRNKYASVIDKLIVEFYYGSSRIYRNNFLEARHIGEILFLDGYSLNRSSEMSRDMQQLFEGSPCTITYEKMTPVPGKVFAEEDSLSELLPA